jgi:hypothetical protein
VFVAFAFGTFSPYAPWALAHRLPLLSSQQSPSSWLYPAALLLACATAALSESALARSGRARAWLELALLPVVGWVSWDVGQVARQPLEAPVLQEPGSKVPESTGGFVTETKLPSNLEYQPGEWSPTTLPAERANVGTIECNMFQGLNNFPGLGQVIPGYDGRPSELGARGKGEADYHGEVFVLDGHGTATVAAWTPNAVEVRVEGARPGDHVVLNQNWDPGWSVSGADAANVKNAVAGGLRAPASTVIFRYTPPGLWPGLVILVATSVGLLWAWRFRRRMARPALETVERGRADAAKSASKASGAA